MLNSARGLCRDAGPDSEATECKEVTSRRRASSPVPPTVNSANGPTGLAAASPAGSGVKVRSKWLREKPYNGGRPCPKLDHINQVYEVVPVSERLQSVRVGGRAVERVESQQRGLKGELRRGGPDPESQAGMTRLTRFPLTVSNPVQSVRVELFGFALSTCQDMCMLNTIDGPSESVEDYLCDPEEMPLGARESRLPCPEDCVLNDWGPWSRCSLPCTTTNSRVRMAYTLRSPSVGRQCPDTTDHEPCGLNHNCFNYFYNITDWSTCQLSPNAVCGSGIKTRMLDCVRSDGKSVDIKFCQELNLEKKWQMNISCVVECPVNCQLSEWSAWSECSQTCGLEGKMWRQRSVVQASQGDGRPCPTQMEQWKPCPVRPCYRWQYSPWSECRVESVVCGHGMRYRNLSCFVSDGSGDGEGSLVDEELCSSLELAIRRRQADHY
ncbi:Thrombospondin type-1 domain-containing protein 7A [Larimichthys crocea]|uniref:Uncharacterized protein n=1 Tax=Larimichthys crocea TaxID=215358 RepID=A0ACD3QUD4_LARCR|nr:Thrombospondin type-1 domain-containing protein 7A [Larimichthys crocea]